MDDTPLHEQERAGRQDQRVEDIRDHEDGIEHDGEAEEDRFVDLEDLGRQGQAADFPIARLLGVPHDERQGDGCAGAADGPEQCDQEGIHQDPGQRVQGEDHRLESRLHEMVNVHSQHEANHPEHDHQKE